MKAPIPFLSFKHVNKQIKSEITSAFEAFFDDGWYILGERLKAFEKSYAAFSHTQYCIGVSNGLDALSIALRSLNIGIGDEVIVPSNTYIASALAVSYTGARPVFVEPDLLTYNLDPKEVAKAITSQTKVIMPVHLYGQACDMTSIMKLATDHDLYVIEDNAQSQGAAHSQKPTGSWGQINATSFYPGKNLGALGDAGAVTTNDALLAESASMLRNYGSAKKYENEIIGYNMRMDECQAAFLSIKLRYLSKWTIERQQIATWYDHGLSDLEEITLPYTLPDSTHVYHLYVIRSQHRNELQRHLNDLGIGTLIHYPIPPYLQKAYYHLGIVRGQYPIAEEIADTCLSLPLYPGLSRQEVNEIVTAIKSFYS